MLFTLFLTAKRLVPKLLNSCPMNVIRAFYWKTWRYMDTYRYILTLFYTSLTYHVVFIRKGLDAKQAEYAVKKYRSHHKIGAGIMMTLNIMDNPQ
jgi:hypothetical protein